MEREEKIHACYLHACLKYVSKDFMTNTSIRQRFGLDNKNSSTASRIIKDALVCCNYTITIRCSDSIREL